MPNVNASKTLLAVDIGGTHIRLAGFQAETTTCLPIYSIASQQVTPANYLAVFIETIQSYCTTHHIELSAIVIGIPGVLAPDLSHAVFVANLQAVAQADFVPALAHHFDCPVLLEHDSNLLLLGEWRNGGAQTDQSVLGVFIGTGVGASYLVNGQVARGKTGTALELGHIPIRHGEVQCVCGKLDCLEAYASGRILAQIAEQAKLPIADIFAEGLKRTDLQSHLMDFIEDNARAIAIAAQLFDPARVVIGGGVSQMSGFPQAQFVEMIRAHLLNIPTSQPIEIKWMQLGEQAFIYGAQAVWELRQNNQPHRLF